MAYKKPVIALLHTGGTIAMETNKDGYRAPAKGPEEMIECATKVEPRINNYEFVFGLMFPRRSADGYVFGKDSSVMGSWDREVIGTFVANYCSMDEVDGIVVAHGTDSMTNTMARLYFGLKYQNKPVVLTGAQVPIGDRCPNGEDSDAMGNLRLALETAATSDIMEPQLAFNGKLLLADNLVKKSKESYDAFTRADNRKREPRTVDNHSKPYFDPAWNKKVYMIDLDSDSDTEDVLECVLPKAEGVVFRGLGAGNASPEFGKIMKEFPHLPMVMAASPCGVTDQLAYEVGAELATHTVTSGDWTPEFAKLRLAYIIGHGESKKMKKEETHEVFVQGANFSDNSEEEAECKREKYMKKTGFYVSKIDRLPMLGFRDMLAELHAEKLQIKGSIVGQPTVVTATNSIAA